MTLKLNRAPSPGPGLAIPISEQQRFIVGLPDSIRATACNYYFARRRAKGAPRFHGAPEVRRVGPGEGAAG